MALDLMILRFGSMPKAVAVPTLVVWVADTRNE